MAGCEKVPKALRGCGASCTYLNGRCQAFAKGEVRAKVVHCKLYQMLAGNENSTLGPSQHAARITCDRGC